jgi:magnesium-transporting ATPase (P-type)
VLLRGTKVLSGKGAYVVIGVGKNSSLEKIEQKIKAENEKASILRTKIDLLERRLSKIGVISAIVTLCCLVGRLFYDLHRSG